MALTESIPLVFFFFLVFAMSSDPRKAIGQVEWHLFSKLCFSLATDPG